MKCITHTRHVRWNSNTETLNQPRSMGKNPVLLVRGHECGMCLVISLLLTCCGQLTAWLTPRWGYLAPQGDKSSRAWWPCPSPQWVWWQAALVIPKPSLTWVSPQVSREGIPAAAGVVTQVTLEGLFTWVQLYMAQKVALLGKGGSTLIALERAFSYGKIEKICENKKILCGNKRKISGRKLFSHCCSVTSTGCRFDITWGFQTKPASFLMLHWLGQFDLKI